MLGIFFISSFNFFLSLYFEDRVAINGGRDVLFFQIVNGKKIMVTSAHNWPQHPPFCLILRDYVYVKIYVYIYICIKFGWFAKVIYGGLHQCFKEHLTENMSSSMYMCTSTVALFSVCTKKNYDTISSNLQTVFFLTQSWKHLTCIFWCFLHKCLSEWICVSGSRPVKCQTQLNTLQPVIVGRGTAS